MTMTSLDPTSLEAILPSGETLLLVKPGMSRVVGRTRGVFVPEFCRMGMGSLWMGVSEPALLGGADGFPISRGLEGAVVAGVSLFAIVAVGTSGIVPVIAAAREPRVRGGSRLTSRNASCGCVRTGRFEFESRTEDGERV